ncbi:MAG: signal peptidase I [Bacillota bacterium]
MSQEPKNRLLNFWRNYLRPFLFIVIILTAFRSSVADWNDVPSGSMKPSILEGDRIFVNKLAYDLKIPFTTVHLARWSDPKRGEVVIFYSPKDGTRLVKRVVGVPGDAIELREDELFVNGVKAEYQPLDSSVVKQVPLQEQANRFFAIEQTAEAKHPVMISPNVPAMRSFGPVKLTAGQYFVMGDNRDFSFDSRYFGPVDRRLIVGRALSVIASLDVNHYFVPRWSRFFKPLP